MTIPANTTATVILPATGADAITESGHPLAQVDGISVDRSEAGRTVLKVGSGHYVFRYEISLKPAAQPLAYAIQISAIRPFKGE